MLSVTCELQLLVRKPPLQPFMEMPLKIGLRETGSDYRISARAMSPGGNSRAV
jgi:hypothetical protein